MVTNLRPHFQNGFPYFFLFSVLNSRTSSNICKLDSKVRNGQNLPHGNPNFRNYFKNWKVWVKLKFSFSKSGLYCCTGPYLSTGPYRSTGPYLPTGPYHYTGPYRSTGPYRFQKSKIMILKWKYRKHEHPPPLDFLAQKVNFNFLGFAPL